MATDMELLSAWRGGDDRAGERLIRRHYAPIERFFLSKARDDAKDLIQRTFAALVESQDKIEIRQEGGKDVRCYLFGIARNVLLSHFRNVRRSQRHLDPYSHSVEDLSPGAHTWVVKHQRSQQLLQALWRLPLDQQIVLELYYWENLTAAELATILEIPEGTVRTRIRSAKRRLGSELERLARSPAEVQGMPSSLDSWVREIREHLGRAG